MVNSILIPIIRKEFDFLLTWIEYCPSPGIPCNIFFSIDMEWNQEEKDKLLHAITNSSFSNKASVYFINCMIHESESFYIREKNRKIDLHKYPYGAKSGPNKQFFISMNEVMQYSCALGLILLEVDAYPVKDFWLRQINERISWIDNAYIIGARVKENIIVPPIRTHLNGNAVYLIRNEGFKSFLDSWNNILIDLLKINPELAYDVALDYYHNTIDISKNYNEIAFCGYERKSIEIPHLILNLYGMDDRFKTTHDVASYIDHNSYIIIHGKISLGESDLLKNYYCTRGNIDFT